MCATSDIKIWRENTNMFQLLFAKPIRKIGFEDVLIAISQPSRFVLINTLPASEQHCLIAGTTPADKEEACINEILNSYSATAKTIVVYGRNCADDTPEKKHKQILSLGIGEIWVYSGGLFEWLLLQDIYGTTQFPTTSVPKDILKYR